MFDNRSLLVRRERSLVTFRSPQRSRYIIGFQRYITYRDRGLPGGVTAEGVPWVHAQ